MDRRIVGTAPQITHIPFDAEDIKFRNTKFLDDSMNHDMVQYDIPDQSTYQEVRGEIWRVRNQDLRKLMRRFPLTLPVKMQCGLWMRALVGRHFFRDANHRTAIALLRDLLEENGLKQPPWPTARSRQAIKESKKVRKHMKNHSTSVTLDTLYEYDRLYWVWWKHTVDVVEIPK